MTSRPDDKYFTFPHDMRSFEITQQWLIDYGELAQKLCHGCRAAEPSHMQGYHLAAIVPSLWQMIHIDRSYDRHPITINGSGESGSPRFACSVMIPSYGDRS